MEIRGNKIVTKNCIQNELMSCDERLNEVDNETPRPHVRSYSRLAKLCLPHIGMVCLLCTYVASGAALFQAIELPAEQKRAVEKLFNLRILHRKIVENTYELCQDSLNVDDYNNYTMDNLRLVSEAHLSIPSFTSYVDIVSESSQNPEFSSANCRWSYPAAVLYAVGLVTTAGYGYVAVETTLGKLLSIAFGLVGLPLFIMTAADLGKFLSEIASSAYDHVTGTDRRMLEQQAADKFRAVTEVPGLYGSAEVPDPVPILDPLSEQASFEPSALFVFGCTFCVATQGALMYKVLENWSFVDAIFFTFNAMSNISLLDRPVSGILFSSVTVAFLIIALAVVTMSVDLAQHRIRKLFSKIHYFGRAVKRFSQRLRIDSELRAVLMVITSVRKKNPGKKHICLDDIVNYMNEELQILNAIAELAQAQANSIAARSASPSFSDAPPTPPSGRPPSTVTVLSTTSSSKSKSPSNAADGDASSLPTLTIDDDCVIFKTDAHTYKVQGGVVSIID